MKFAYEYRTSENEVRRGVLSAPSRDAAYAALKGQGIRPSRVEDAPGFFNVLFGRGKRWLAIGVLSVVAGVLSLLLVRRPEAPVQGIPTVEQRAYIPGLAVPEFRYSHERFLALFAMPGCEVKVPSVTDELVADFAANVGKRLEADPKDTDDVRRFKGIVAGMKADARKFVNVPNGLRQYCQWLAERQQMECQLRHRYADRVAAGTMTKDSANRVLRTMGFPPLD